MRRRVIRINGIILVVGLLGAEIIPFLLFRNSRFEPNSIGVWLSQPFIFAQTTRDAFLFWGISIAAFVSAFAIALVWNNFRGLSFTTTTVWMLTWWGALWVTIVAGGNRIESNERTQS